MRRWRVLFVAALAVAALTSAWALWRSRAPTPPRTGAPTATSTETSDVPSVPSDQPLTIGENEKDPQPQTPERPQHADIAGGPPPLVTAGAIVLVVIVLLLLVFLRRRTFDQPRPPVPHDDVTPPAPIADPRSVRRGDGHRARRSPERTGPPGYRPGIVVKVRDAADAEPVVSRLSPGGSSHTAWHFQPLVRSIEPARLRELEDRAVALDPEYTRQGVDRYVRIQPPPEATIGEVLDALRADPAVVAVYAEGPPVRPPQAVVKESQQDYLDAAPDGVGARSGRSKPGADGSGVRLIDVEQGWTMDATGKTVDHVDLPPVPLLWGVSLDTEGHGTAVLGVVCAKSDHAGTTGIVPAVRASLVSEWVTPTLHNRVDALYAAIDALQAGDILLLEMQTTDETFSVYLPVEFELACFEAIRLAVALDIVVIEPAGNSYVDLDDGTLYGLGTRFQRGSAGFMESGAILVGGCTSGKPRVEWSGTNYGSRVDCCAWAENVVTTGGEDAKGATDPHVAYTPAFAGTSSASAIIAGVAARIQSLAVADGKPVYGPWALRTMLSDPTVNTVLANAAVPIGVMPDLKAIRESATLP